MFGINNSQFDGEPVLRKIGFFTLAFFFLVAFQSKPLINLLGGFSLLFSFIYIYLYNRDIFKNNPYLILFIAPYFIGIVLSFFSYSGIDSTISFLGRFKFMLLVLPLAAFVNSRKELHILLAMLFLSAIIAVGYGVYTNQPYAAFHGFHIIGRTADMMIIVCLTALVYLVQSKLTLNANSIFLKFILALMVGTFAWALIMSEMRGSWLGLGVGGIVFIAVLLFVDRRALLYMAPLLSILAISVMFQGNVENNVSKINSSFKSIIETQNNESNEARLHLWKTGWDFSKDHFSFGTGAKQSKEMFIEFFNAQPDAYQKKYHYAINYPGNYHNSYLQIHVEAGIVFFFFYIISLVYVLAIIFINIKKVKSADQKYLISAFVTSIAFMVTQVFHNDLYSYGSTAFYLVLFSGCYILNQSYQLTESEKVAKNEI